MASLHNASETIYIYGIFFFRNKSKKTNKFTQNSKTTSEDNTHIVDVNNVFASDTTNKFLKPIIR